MRVRTQKNIKFNISEKKMAFALFLQHKRCNSYIYTYAIILIENSDKRSIIKESSDQNLKNLPNIYIYIYIYIQLFYAVYQHRKAEM